MRHRFLATLYPSFSKFGREGVDGRDTSMNIWVAGVEMVYVGLKSVVELQYIVSKYVESL